MKIKNFTLLQQRQRLNLLDKGNFTYPFFDSVDLLKNFCII